MSRANAITTNVIRLASSQGCKVWRSNVMGVFDMTLAVNKIWNLVQGMRVTTKEIKQVLSNCYRRSHEQKGASDILGYTPTGRFLAIEIKAKGDKLSIEQQQFLNELAMKNGISIVVAEEPEKIKFQVLGASGRVIVVDELGFLPALRQKLAE